ncbi:hypothetical protein [Sediminitomix flava]|uniref:Uncharacterized protein n=1 Tax=Sediminitomix flava TaxID=379075 RepID=A0A315ZG04_SEDFL|nr:hypothetical protein [Sediminitomix flava]PWJ44242.1 hypothetical protein BC781_101592 [Sediminitomix flava]
MQQFVIPILLLLFITYFSACETVPYSEDNFVRYTAVRYLDGDTIFCRLQKSQDGATTIGYLVNGDFDSEVTIKHDTFPSFDDQGFYFFKALMKKLDQPKESYKTASIFNLDTIEVIYDSLVLDYKTGNFKTDSCYIYRIIPPKKNFMGFTLLKFYIDFDRGIVLKGLDEKTKTDANIIFEILGKDNN